MSSVGNDMGVFMVVATIHTLAAHEPFFRRGSCRGLWDPTFNGPQGLM